MTDNNENNLRPWGHYEILSDDMDYKVKRITLRPGKRLSLQYHRRRDEHWFIVRGKGLLTIGSENYEFSEGQSVDIKKDSPHRLENTGMNDLIYIEVQTGDYFGEDDIMRLEDDFGRAGKIK